MDTISAHSLTFGITVMDTDFQGSYHMRSKDRLELAWAYRQVILISKSSLKP